MTQSKSEKIASDTFWYTFATYFAQLMGLFTGIATRKLVQPQEMGQWVLLQTLLNYGLFAEMGILTAMVCRVPFYLGKNDPDAARRTRDAAFTFSFSASLVIAVVYLAASFWLPSLNQPAMRLGVAVVALLIVLTLLYNFYISYLWGTNGFQLLGWGIILNSILNVAAVMTLVRLYGLAGLYASTTLVTFCSLLFLMAKSKILPSFRLDFRAIGDLLVYGFPMILGGLASVLLLSMDRWVITRFLNFEALGYYSIATIVLPLAVTAPKMASIVLFPRMQEDFAATGSLDAATQKVVKPDLLIASFSPIFLGLAYLALPLFVQCLLPKYVAGIPAALILLGGSYFLSLAYNSENFLITIDKRAHSVPFLLAAVGVATAASVIFIKKSFGLNGVAMGMSLGFLFYFLTLTAYVLSHHLKGRQMAAHYGQIFGHFIYFAISVVFIARLSFGERPWANLAARGALWILVSAPVLIRTERQHGVLKRLWYNRPIFREK